MDHAESKQWIADLARRMPDLAKHVRGMPDETKRLWHDEIFSKHELRDALAMNRKLFETGEGGSRWERDKIASVFIRHLSEISYAREQRERTQRRETRGAQQRVKSDPVMAAMTDYVAAKCVAFKRDHDAYPTDEMFRQWSEEASERFDKAADDERAGPRYRCRDCSDTGYASQDDGSVGCCLCDTGKQRFKSWCDAGKRIAFAAGAKEATDNQFNHALNGDDDDDTRRDAESRSGHRDGDANDRAKATAPGATADAPGMLPAVQASDGSSDPDATQTLLDL